MPNRNTIQRAIVLEAVKSLNNHPTADEVYAFVSAKEPTISRATVYRNLNKLVEEGEIRKVEISTGADRFDSWTGEHYHFHCSRCGRVYDIACQDVTGLQPSVANRNGFEVDGFEIMFNGICPDCKKEGENEPAGSINIAEKREK